MSHLTVQLRMGKRYGIYSKRVDFFSLLTYHNRFTVRFVNPIEYRRIAVLHLRDSTLHRLYTFDPPLTYSLKHTLFTLVNLNKFDFSN